MTPNQTFKNCKICQKCKFRSQKISYRSSNVMIFFSPLYSLSTAVWATLVWTDSSYARRTLYLAKLENLGKADKFLGLGQNLVPFPIGIHPFRTERWNKAETMVDSDGQYFEWCIHLIYMSNNFQLLCSGVFSFVSWCILSPWNIQNAILVNHFSLAIYQKTTTTSSASYDCFFV